MITKEEVSKILDLNPKGIIAQEIADRQLEVIWKGYQYLISDKKNSILYIADEVGLGKTYIGLGIAQLFRHLNKKGNNRDVIIVPKQNLQQKWFREFEGFWTDNYIGKSTTLEPVNPVVWESLDAISKAGSINILRTSSFSNWLNRRSRGKSELYYFLRNEIFAQNEFCKERLDAAYGLDYFPRKDQYIPEKLKNLTACLLNIAIGPIQCLLVDEAHTYKYGPDDEESEQSYASARNKITARFLGAVRDKSLFVDFPELKDKLHSPQKVICLSATPKDRQLLEIRNQFNCFTRNHLLRGENNEGIATKLSQFLIRGNMEYMVSGKRVSRNQARHEHRRGNVNLSESPQPLQIEDNFDGLFWQFIQYKSLKHLKLKNNALFEMGMLAGFESYTLDVEKRWKRELPTEPVKEYENYNKKVEQSQDYNLIKDIIKSFNRSFPQELPPHPKQTRFEAEILRLMKIQKKSLTFVRRVATVKDLEERILHRFEEGVIINKWLTFSGKYKPFLTPKVNQMIEEWQKKGLESSIRKVLLALVERRKIKRILKEKGIESEAEYHYLRACFWALENKSFKEEIEKLAVQSEVRISSKTISIAIEAIHQTPKPDTEDEIRDNDAQEESDPHDKYFFNQYFVETRGGNGASFRKKLYQEPWFEIEIGHIANHFQLFRRRESDKNSSSWVLTKEVGKNKLNKFNSSAHKLEQFLRVQGELADKNYNSLVFRKQSLPNSTFITKLLIGPCSDSFRTWIVKRNCMTVDNLLSELKILNSVLRGVFRNGSGLLPSFIADSKGGNFDTNLLQLLDGNKGPFHFVLDEIRIILEDYSLIYSQNFRGKSEREVAKMFAGLSPVVGVSGSIQRNRSTVAAQFRMPGFPYAVICTDILREGEDLHTFCQNVYHYGIAWNPSDMEQRTGRIDRINSMSYRQIMKEDVANFDQKIQVFYPYLQGSVEVNQVIRLFQNLNRFLETFNDITNELRFESKVNIDESIHDNGIPEAILEKLESKYDVYKFNPVSK